jgi:hypothetical protein
MSILWTELSHWTKTAGKQPDASHGRRPMHKPARQDVAAFIDKLFRRTFHRNGYSGAAAVSGAKSNA